jgi:hypothetical protein
MREIFGIFPEMSTNITVFLKSGFLTFHASWSNFIDHIMIPLITFFLLTSKSEH